MKKEISAEIPLVWLCGSPLGVYRRGFEIVILILYYVVPFSFFSYWAIFLQLRLMLVARKVAFLFILNESK